MYGRSRLTSAMFCFQTDVDPQTKHKVRRRDVALFVFNGTNTFIIYYFLCLMLCCMLACVIRLNRKLHNESKKNCHSTFIHNFDRCWPIFKILLLLYSPRNLQQNPCYTAHHNLVVSLHYLVKLKIKIQPFSVTAFTNPTQKSVAVCDLCWEAGGAVRGLYLLAVWLVHCLYLLPKRADHHSVKHISRGCVAGLARKTDILPTTPLIFFRETQNCKICL